ncbi:MAG TPA: hypothetical protein VGL89_18645 [Candidatus Koribacter sp.]
MKKTLSIAIVVASLLFFAACTVHTEDGKDGKGDKVDIKTPFGSLKVDENVDAKDTGLPGYPGAKPYTEKGDGHNAANVNISSEMFGVKVVAAEFTTTDPPSKVHDFYAKALGSYGKVLECKGSYNITTHKGNNNNDDKPVTCDNVGSHPEEVELKVGTDNHQHVVGLKPDGSGTRFGLVYVNTRGKESGS